MPGSGFSKFQKNNEDRETFRRNLQAEREVAFTYSEVFSSFYGNTTALQLSNEGHKVNNFSFSRTAGISLARVYLLANSDLSMEEVFFDQHRNDGDTIEEMDRTNYVLEVKKEAGQAVLDILDNNSAERASEILFDMYFKALPRLRETMEDISDEPYKAVLNVRTENQILAGRVSELMFDIFQETTSSDKHKNSLQKAIDNYNQRNGEESFTRDKLLDLSASISDEFYHTRYRERINTYLNADNPLRKEVALQDLFTSVVTMKYRDSIRKKHMAEGKGKTEAITYNESQPIEQCKDAIMDAFTLRFRPYLNSLYSSSDIEHALYTGELFDSANIELNDNGSVKKISLMGITYDAVNRKISLPDGKLSKMALRNENVKELSQVMKDTNVYLPSTEENFVALTGMTKKEFFNNTHQFGLNFSRQTAQSFIITKLVGDGMDFKDALDPNKFVEEKRKASEELRNLLQKPVPKEGTPEYKERFEKVVRFSALGYWKANKKFEEILRTATENENLITSPDLLYTSEEGRTAYALSLMIHDLNQEFSKKGACDILNDVSKLEKNPTVLEGLVNLGASCYCLKAVGPLPKACEDLLIKNGENFTPFLNDIIDAKLVTDYFHEKSALMRANNEEVNYLTFANPEDVALAKLPLASSTSQKMVKALRSQLLNHFTIDELSKKGVSGEFLKSIHIEREGDHFKSISALGIKVDKYLNITKEDGKLLPDVMSDETKDMYKRHLRSLIKLANSTDELLVFNNTQNFKDFITGINNLKPLLKRNDLDYDTIYLAMEPVIASMEAYRKDHKDKKLDSFQKKRLNAMDQVEDFYSSLKLRERDLDDRENTSLPLRNLRTTRYAIEKNIIANRYEENDGRKTFDSLAIASANRVYDLVLNKTEITPEMQKDLITDLKIIALSRVLEEEKIYVSPDGGAITKVVKENPTHLKELIEGADVGELKNLPVFSNPTRENLEKTFRQDLITGEVKRLVRNIGNKLADEKEKQRLAAQKEKEQESKATEKKVGPAKV